MSSNASIIQDYDYSVTPSEKEIWKRWQNDWNDPRIIKHAINDNEFRKKIRFSDVDATLNRWKELGLNTLKEE